MDITAIIFDLDGVIVTTDECHYQGWQRLADDEGIYFDRAINERLRGVSRMESLAILLERSARAYSEAERVQLAERKNGYYRALIESLTPADILPGVQAFMADARARGLKLAIGSSSKNAPTILARVGLADYFDTVVCGNDITRSKPDPEVFLLGAARLGIPPPYCLVVEDADAGVEAALAAAMPVLGVGSAASHPRATRTAPDLSAITVEELLSEAVVGGRQGG